MRGVKELIPLIVLALGKHFDHIVALFLLVGLASHLTLPDFKHMSQFVWVFWNTQVVVRHEIRILFPHVFVQGFFDVYQSCHWSCVILVHQVNRIEYSQLGKIVFLLTRLNDPHQVFPHGIFLESQIYRSIVDKSERSCL